MEEDREWSVWNRVLNPGGPTAEEALLPERLETLITEQRSGAVVLRRLAERLRGQERQVFLRMAADGESRARELTAFHFLLSGRRLRLRRPCPAVPADLPEALREAYLRQRDAARAVHALAADYACCAELLLPMEKELSLDQRRILHTIQGLLTEKT